LARQKAEFGLRFQYGKAKGEKEADRITGQHGGLDPDYPTALLLNYPVTAGKLVYAYVFGCMSRHDREDPGGMRVFLCAVCIDDGADEQHQHTLAPRGQHSI
jgi:hypothetical protein